MSDRTIATICLWSLFGFCAAGAAIESVRIGEAVNLMAGVSHLLLYIFVSARLILVNAMAAVTGQERNP